MKVVIALFAIAVVSTSGTTSGTVLAATVSPLLVRAPSFDSAVIKSDRVGGNFAYSTVEGHAYASVSPVVQHVVEPVAVSYGSHRVPLGYVGAPVAPYVPQHVISAPPPYSFGSSIFSHPGFGISFSPIAAANPVQFHPLFPVSPVPGPVGPVGPVAQKPIADAPQPPQPTGTAIDEDTVSVEAAS